MTDPDPERAAGIAALARVLDSLPARNDKVRPTPLHPKTREQLAEEQYDRGLRLHPELAMKFPIPGRQAPGVPAYMSLPQWVDADRYARHLRDNPQQATEAPAPGATLEQLRKIFEITNPQAAATLPTLDDAELAAQREEYAAKLPGAFAKLQQIAARNRNLQGAQQNPRGAGSA